MGDIAAAAIALRDVLPAKKSNIDKVIAKIDYMNDLEHNNDLYLAQYCTFKFRKESDEKKYSEEKQIISKCSREIQRMWRDVAR